MTGEDVEREAEVEYLLEREVNDSAEKLEEEHKVENTEEVEEPEKKLNASKEPKVKEIGIEDEAKRKEICLFSFNILINVKCQFWEIAVVCLL